MNPKTHNQLTKLTALLNSNEHFTKVISQKINQKIEFSVEERQKRPSLPEYIIQHQVEFRIIGFELPSNLIKDILEIFPDQLVFIGVPFEFKHSTFKVSWQGDFIHDQKTK